MSTLQQFIEARHRHLDISMLETYPLFNTKKRYTRLMNQGPERATLTDVLRLAKRLRIHPLTLIDEHNMGTLMITKEDRIQLRDHYVTNPPNTALRDEKPSRFLSPATGPQVAGANH